MTGNEKLGKMDTDPIRENLNKYTAKAFHMLPKMNEPCILDIGCGSGVPTMELARLSNGQVVAIDIDQAALDKLSKNIEQAGLSHRIKTLRCSMFELDFQDESFDIIWAEGSISRIGFKRGLEEWRRFLKPNGFLVIHDDINNIHQKLKHISSCGYEILGHFTLSEDIWWAEYYGPLERRINDILMKYIDESKDFVEFDSEQQEIEMFKKNPKLFRSVFFVMQKR